MGFTDFSFQIAKKGVNHVRKVAMTLPAAQVRLKGHKAFRHRLIKFSWRKISHAKLFKDAGSINQNSIDHLQDVLHYVWLSAHIGPEEPREATAHDHDVKILPLSVEGEAIPFPRKPFGRFEVCPVGGSVTDAFVPVAIHESIDHRRSGPVLAFPIETYSSEGELHNVGGQVPNPLPKEGSGISSY
jgi:hypothetical protein